MNVPMEPAVFLEGSAINLCIVRRMDAPQYMQWLNDAETASFLSAHLPVTMEKELEFLDSMLNSDPAKNIILGIWHKETERLIGNIGLHNIHPRDHHAMMGIFIGCKELWGKGLGREAMILLLRYCFDTLNLQKVWLEHWDHNQRGHRAYVAAGFKEVGRLRRHRFVSGAWRDQVVMDILREEFFALHGGGTEKP